MRSAGPGSVRRGAIGGPACLLAAYLHGCREATYRLSVFGVDTIARTRFTVLRRARRCRVAVVSSFEVVPRLETMRTGSCAALQAGRAGVVATGCSAVLGRELSLEGPSPGERRRG